MRSGSEFHARPGARRAQPVKPGRGDQLRKRSDSRQNTSREIALLERTIERLRRELESGDMPAARMSELAAKLEAARVRLIDLRLTAAMERGQEEAALQAKAEAPQPRRIKWSWALLSPLRRMWGNLWQQSAMP